MSNKNLEKIIDNDLGLIKAHDAYFVNPYDLEIFNDIILREYKNTNDCIITVNNRRLKNMLMGTIKKGSTWISQGTLYPTNVYKIQENNIIYKNRRDAEKYVTKMSKKLFNYVK